MSGLSLSTADALLRDSYLPAIMRGLGIPPELSMALRTPDEGWTSRYTWDRTVWAAHRPPEPAIVPLFDLGTMGRFGGIPVYRRPFMPKVDLFPRSTAARRRFDRSLADVRHRLSLMWRALRGDLRLEDYA